MGKRTTEEQRERHRAYMKRWHAENPRTPAQAALQSAQISERRRVRKRTEPEYAAKLRQQVAESRVAVAHAARERVRRAVRVGRLVKPDSCNRCNTPGYIEASHQDYTHPLDVEWLCRPCHRREDERNPKGGHIRRSP